MNGLFDNAIYSDVNPSDDLGLDVFDKEKEKERKKQPTQKCKSVSNYFNDINDGESVVDLTDETESITNQSATKS